LYSFKPETQDKTIGENTTEDVGGAVREVAFIAEGKGREKFGVRKVQRQCPLVLAFLESSQAFACLSF
jgi:hypothetical protein